MVEIIPHATRRRERGLWLKSYRMRVGGERGCIIGCRMAPARGTTYLTWGDASRCGFGVFYVINLLRGVFGNIDHIQNVGFSLVPYCPPLVSSRLLLSLLSNRLLASSRLLLSLLSSPTLVSSRLLLLLLSSPTSRLFLCVTRPT